MKVILCVCDCEVRHEKFFVGDFITNEFADFLLNDSAYLIPNFCTIAETMTNTKADETMKCLDDLGIEYCFKDIKISF